MIRGYQQRATKEDVRRCWPGETRTDTIAEAGCSRQDHFDADTAARSLGVDRRITRPHCLFFDRCGASLALRPIHFIVPFPAGGSTDVGARVVGEYLSRALGLQIVIENKSGANGNLAIETVAKSAPDGYTVLVSTDAVSTNPHVYQMSIDPLKDLVPVIQLSRQPIALAAHPSLSVSTLAELTALAKQQPGLRFATGSGFGSLQGMVALWYAQLAGISYGTGAISRRWSGD